jgi:hypothetical protein
MTTRIRNSSRLIMSVLILLLIVLGTGCKSKKKAMEAADKKRDKEYLEQQAAAAEKQRLADEQAKKEAEERARREAEAKNVEPKQKLDGYFNSISSASNPTSANTSISEALGMFASPQTPVLIVISEFNGQKDYDRPTTIVDYLNYLKDQKKNMNKISNIQYDASGRITELELTKQK